MGLRYSLYRLYYEVKRKFGVLERQFSSTTPNFDFITLNEWRRLELPFFFNRKSELDFHSEVSEELIERVRKVKEGTIRFFSSTDFNLGTDYDWVTNPTTDYTYDNNIHWSKIETLGNNGDIKYVWEKSRFCYLYDLIKLDKASKGDQAEFVFLEMDSWIRSNPENKGPNYVCSQETSIRLLNWTFTLMYYRDSSFLSEERLHNYLNSIYKQVKHVEQNINFSRYCVRNNHAITECFLLYFVGVMFPFFDESDKWKSQGQNYLEDEIEFQFFEDGGYLQYSHNYHRVALQVMTWALIIGKNAGTQWSSKLTTRLNDSLIQLNSLMDLDSGYLPNYGNNDGALFFQLSESNFRDYRPQLNALSYALSGKCLYKGEENLSDIKWYANSSKFRYKMITSLKSFDDSGLYVMESGKLKVIIKCTNHVHRPAQADNLHMDVWYDGKNVLLDGGSYKYNTSLIEINYFMGTASHNTVMLDKENQMLKASRFIWNYWTNEAKVKLTENKENIEFEGVFSGFKQMNPRIKHHRFVKLNKNELTLEVIDTVINKPSNTPMTQIWNKSQDYKSSFSSDGTISNSIGYYSDCYGIKTEIESIRVTSSANSIKSTFKFKL
ncbi:MAG: heparinase [Bacteroidetes bacterium]|nr:MAG: heparinase [Bacteroidota bacterium]